MNIKRWWFDDDSCIVSLLGKVNCVFFLSDFCKAVHNKGIIRCGIYYEGGRREKYMIIDKIDGRCLDFFCLKKEIIVHSRNPSMNRYTEYFCNADNLSFIYNT